jgi:oxygen-independent coproporphyrinogen-3 oxidase
MARQSLVDLIQKYDRSGPRYTSYPPAPVFSDAFGHREYREAILTSQASDHTSDVSLYVHFPFCDTLCYFCGCTTVITQNRDRIGEYIDYLKKEIDLLAPLLSSDRRVVQMHWGGGTPTYLTPAQVFEIGDYIRKKFTFAPEAEVSVEVDPRDLTHHHLRILRKIGFNRISLGVQDFDPKVQYAVNRNQSEFITRQTIDWSRSLGFGSMNIDLIYGLPLQSVESFTTTLDKIIGISPDRIAVYNFAYVPWMKKHQKLIHVEDLPGPETKLALLMATVDRLSSAGYVYIGMDHFAKPEDEMTIARANKTLHRNFQGYSTKAGADMFGLGMSSIGHFATYYAQNEKTLPEYYAAIDGGRLPTRVGYRMTQDDMIRKHVIMRLMCDLTLDIADVERRFAIDFSSYFAAALKSLQPLVEDGLVGIADGAISVAPDGRFFLRNLAMCFDAYMDAVGKEKPLFSRTV